MTIYGTEQVVIEVTVYIYIREVIDTKIWLRFVVVFLSHTRRMLGYLD